LHGEMPLVKALGKRANAFDCAGGCHVL